MLPVDDMGVGSVRLRWWSFRVGVDTIGLRTLRSPGSVVMVDVRWDRDRPPPAWPTERRLPRRRSWCRPRRSGTAHRGDGHGVSLEAIAVEAGVTKPIVYARVGSRADLSGVLADRLGDRLLAAVNSQAVEDPTDRRAR